MIMVEMTNNRQHHFVYLLKFDKVGERKCKGLFIYVLLACMLLLLPIGYSSAAKDGDTPVATGKGIVITKEDVNDFRKYMEKRKFSTSDQQLLKVLIRVTLFATEAEKLGLGRDKEFSGKEYAKLDKTIRLSEMYIDKLKNEYSVSDDVIESYYFSNTARFPAHDGKQPRIDDGQKQEIQQIIRDAKRPEIARKAFEDLKREYEIRLVGGNN